MPQPLLKFGLCPNASDALRFIDIKKERLGQTIGAAKASAGTHAIDGAINGAHYTAALDLRIRDLSLSEIRLLLDKLGSVGFAAWYRPLNWDGHNGSPHIHCVYAGVPMKLSLRNQIHAYVHGLNGLASHARYTFHPPTAHSIATVRELFLSSGNPING